YAGASRPLPARQSAASEYPSAPGRAVSLRFAQGLRDRWQLPTPRILELLEFRESTRDLQDCLLLPESSSRHTSSGATSLTHRTANLSQEVFLPILALAHQNSGLS